MPEQEMRQQMERGQFPILRHGSIAGKTHGTRSAFHIEAWETQAHSHIKALKHRHDTFRHVGGKLPPDVFKSPFERIMRCSEAGNDRAMSQD
ncbi:hypothetical protein GCM10011316_14840 [Roseibium aquae]|uniref:Uncharacterized protein n=1 Tax=Roseibium aquae TaxID=1323746 RepID=A0A916THE4_9HYPH|nr:hypothetical protein GCM10011316_14840 [Roseibium aquae]